MREGRARALLRDAMKGIAPYRVLQNWRKVGFDAPIESFLDVNHRHVRSLIFEESPILDHVRRDKIEELFDKPDLLNSESEFLFYFLTSEMFLEKCAA